MNRLTGGRCMLEKRRRASSHEISIRIFDLDELVRTEGEAQAIQHGYKPGDSGFKELGLNDADDITKRLGEKLWDQPDEPKNFLILRE